MAITINGNTNSIIGLANGGLPDGCILDADINGMAASKLTGALPAISGASLTGIAGGLTVAQQFRLTSPFNIPNSYTTISSNWEKVDSTGQGALGSFADPSSGVFTFPSTGFYLVRFNGYFEDGGDAPSAVLRIQATTNNSSYSSIGAVVTSNSNLDTYTYCSATLETLIDVTNVSNVKVYFEAYNQHTAVLDGSSAQNRTYVTFIRLGDT